MATLPDLPTDDISLMAYYNVIDNNNTLNNISPIEAISSQRVLSYQQFDNGISGEIDLGRGSERPASFRVKKDGWIVVHHDTQKNYVTQTSDSTEPKTVLDLLIAPTNKNVTGGWAGSANEVVQAIEQLFNNILANKSGSFSIDLSNIQYYSYEFDTATTLDIFEKSGGGSYTFSYPSTITNLKVEQYGAGKGDFGTNSAGASIEGNTLASTGSSGVQFGYLDLLDSGIIPDPNTAYSGNVFGNEGPVTVLLAIYK